MARRPFPRARLWLAAAAALVVAIAAVALRTGADGARPSAPAPRAAAPAPEPLASVPPAPAPAAPAAPAPAAAAPVDPSPAEEHAMAELRAEVDARPETAVAIADEGERRFPSGPYAEERAWLKMRALVHLGRIGIARDAASRFFEQHPDSPLARYVFRLTGVRPMPPLGPPR